MNDALLLDAKLPSGWEWGRISDRYRITKKPRQLNLRDIPEIPFVRMEGVPVNGAEAVAFEMRPPGLIASGTYFEKSDVLLAKITPCFENGKQGLAHNIPREFGIASTEIIPFQPLNGDAEPRFLFYYLLHPEVRHAIAGKMEGSTARQRVPENVARDFPMPLLPRGEQEKIAAVLWKIQRAIEVEEKLIATTRELKHAAMRQLFTRGLRGELLKETEIGPAPQSWESVQLGRHLKLAQYGLSVRGREAGRYPILRMNCQLGGRVVFRDLQFVDLDEKVAGAFRVNDGDLLFNRTNSFELVGRTAIFRSDREAVFASYLIRLALDPTEFHPEFVNHYFNQPSVQADLKRLASRGVSQSNISASKLKEYPVPKTSLIEQREIANAIDTVDRTVSVHERKRATLQELFKTMLHQLMTGQIRVDKLDIDVSEVRT